MIHWIKIFLAAVLLQILIPAFAISEPAESPWVKESVEGIKKIQLYFFWSGTCPHCRKAKPFIAELDQTFDWLELQSFEVSESKENAEYYKALSDKIGSKALGVPAFLFCEQAILGFHEIDTTGVQLRDRLISCKESLVGHTGQAKRNPEEKSEKIAIPGLGEFDPGELSLPAFTIVIAGLDAFNPCAFFVLLLLLSLLVNAKNQKGMLLIGGIFVFFSGFIYFLFMAAWLNLFLYLGELRTVTVIAACIAIGVSAINIKDYFLFRKGISLSIPESAKPGIYGRARGLIKESNVSAMVVGTIILAVVANSYELLCTAGFPMVFTRILTLHGLSSWDYYLYLVLYNFIYVIPLGVIVVIFTKTMGTRKLSEKEGRILKLVSGVMMLELGLLLLFAQEWLSNFIVAIALIVMAIFISFCIVKLSPAENNNGKFKY